jgi:hypothetical protein
VDNQLQVRSDNFKQFLASTPNQSSGNSPQLLPKTSGLGPGDDLYQVTNAAGDILHQSPAMHDLDVPLDTTRLRHRYRHHRDEGDFTTYCHRQGDIRVLAAKVQVRGNELSVQIAMIVSPLYAVLEPSGRGRGPGCPPFSLPRDFGGYWLSSAQWSRFTPSLHPGNFGTKSVEAHYGARSTR